MYQKEGSNIKKFLGLNFQIRVHSDFFVNYHMRLLHTEVVHTTLLPRLKCFYNHGFLFCFALNKEAVTCILIVFFIEFHEDRFFLTFSKLD